MNADKAHISVLLQETLSALIPEGRAPQRLIDGTLGAGGHTGAFLARGVAHVLGLDLDAQAIALARAHLAPFLNVTPPRVTIVQASYTTLIQHAHALGWHDGVDAILLDLGVSSMQLDTPERGFAFRFDAPLDMRFAEDGRPMARDLVNAWQEADLTEIFYRYGEEPHARLIARAIIKDRPLETTQQLAQLIERIVPKPKKRTEGKSIHPATRVFQALRIAVNDELRVIEQTLPLAMSLLRPQGRLAVISFHSLEDRIVKDSFKEASTAIISPPGMASITPKPATVRLITKKPIEATPEEQASNPRARSAKLRIVEKL